jgi:hypothetical protein
MQLPVMNDLVIDLSLSPVVITCRHRLSLSLVVITCRHRLSRSSLPLTRGAPMFPACHPSHGRGF